MLSLLYLLPLLPLVYSDSHVNPHTARHLLKSNSQRDVAAAAELLAREGLQRHVARSPAGHSQKLVRRRKRSCVAKPASSSLASSTASATTSTSEPSVTSSPTESTAAESTASAVTSTSTTSEAASSSAAASGSSGQTGRMAYVMPMSARSDWTTCTDSSSALSFNDALNPLYAGKLPSTASAPDGSNAYVADYPAGIYGLKGGSGFNFYTEGIKDGVDVTTAKEVMFSYSIYFESDFDFNKGGKLPGFFGGTDLASAKSCSGGRQDGRDACFSARLMFRTDGMGELYNYFPQAQYSGYCSTPPYSTCNPDYGDSIGRGSFTWARGDWTTVAQRLKLNDAGQANGEQELFVNGQSVLNLSGLKIVADDSPGTHVYGIMAQTFFGGSGSDWASPKDQKAYFKDWTLAVLS